MYGFVHSRGRLAAINDIKRWMLFFAIKGAFYYKRTESLADGGPYSPVLGKLADPTVGVSFPLYVARFDASPKRWQFGFAADPQMGQWPVLLWIHFWGTLFVLVAPDLNPPIHLTEGVDGLRRIDAAVVRKRDFLKIFPPFTAETLDVFRSGSD